MRLATVVLVGAVLAGCGDDDDGVPDAAVADAASDRAIEADAEVEDAMVDGSADAFVLPVLPMPPVLTPCAAGWREVTAAVGSNLKVCEPWPAGGRQTCAAGSAHFPGEAGCAPIGAACPAGEWATPPVGATVRYVRQGANGGTGTQAKPFGTVAEALVGIAPGTVVALNSATFSEAVSLPANVTLLGACVTGTIVRAPATTALFVIGGTGARIQNLTVREFTGGVLVPSAASVALDGVLLTQNVRLGVHVNGGTATLDNVVVTGTASGFGDRAGLRGDLGATVTVRRAVFENNTSYSMAFEDPGTTATIEDVATTGSRFQNSSDVPGELWVELSARVTVRRAVLERGALVGLWILRQAQLSMEDVVLRGFPAEVTIGGGGGRLTLRRAHLVGNAGHLRVSNTTMTLEDLVLDGTGSGAIGIMPSTGASVTVTRALVAKTRQVAVAAFDLGTRLVATDLDIVDVGEVGCAQTTCPMFSGLSAGLGAYYGGAMEVRRFRVRGSLLCGIQIGPDATMDLHDGVVLGHPIGANVQNTSLASSRLTDNVIYQNTINFDGTALPLPPSPGGS